MMKSLEIQRDLYFNDTECYLPWEGFLRARPETTFVFFSHVGRLNSTGKCKNLGKKQAVGLKWGMVSSIAYNSFCVI